jgi:predicted transcriptional regulator
MMYPPNQRQPAFFVGELGRGGNAMSTVKEELTRLIQEQPEDRSSEEIVRELAFHVMIQRGLADADAGRVISNQEMGRRIRSWQK